MKQYKVEMVLVSTDSHNQAQMLLTKYAKLGYILKAAWPEPAGQDYGATTCFAFERDKPERGSNQ